MNKYIGPMIFFLLVFMGVVYGLFAAAKVEVPGRIEFLLNVTLFISIAYWLKEDSTKANRTGIQDMHFLLVFLWPIILPYHLWKSRRKRGLLILLGAIAAAIITPVIVQAALATLIRKQ
jgi:hypothetical protein